MARYAYERLSTLDNAFLRWEKPNLPMHTSALQIFDAGPLATASGGIDFAAISQHFASKLHVMPTYRQKLEWIPGRDHAVFVDDPDFSIDYHVRHTALPRPGTHEQLERLASRIVEQPLDRNRPLWETWVIEGLEGNRFALISKQHHCLIDGGAGSDLMTSLMSLEPVEAPGPPARFVPRPLPSRLELLRDELQHRATTPLAAIADFARRIRGASDLRAELERTVASLRGLAGFYLTPASETPINGPVGPHRRFETTEVPLEHLLAIRKELRCSVNDVVLTIVTGALRRFLIDRRVDVAKLDFRVSTPVDVRRAHERGEFGNRVSSWIVRLPLGEADPLKQVAAIREATSDQKGLHSADAIEALTELMDWVPFDVQNAASRATNCVVTNVRGPNRPLYLLTARQLAVYGHPPLLENHGLSIGVLSYDGTVCWGLIADADRVPDLALLARQIDDATRALAAAAGIAVRTAQEG